MERRQAAQRQLTNVVFAVLVLQRKFRQMRARRAAGLEINNNWWPTSTLSREQELAMRQSMRIRSALRSAFKRETLEGRRIMTVTHGALMLNVFCAMFCTIPEVEANWRLMKFFNTVEIVTGYVFVNEYLTRLLVAPRWWREAKKPMRILDLCCLLPVLGVVFQASTAYRWRGEVNMWDHVVDLARVLRVLRILDFTCIREAGKKAFRAVSAALGCLAEPGVLALSVWIFSTSLFAWAEHEYDGRDKDHLKSMPDALYWTSMYIKGEWANVDFSRGAGSRLCIFYCIFGLAAFAVPVGLMIEAVENSVTTYAEEHKELKAFLSKHSSDAVARLVEARQTTSRGHSGCLM